MLQLPPSVVIITMMKPLTLSRSLHHPRHVVHHPSYGKPNGSEVRSPPAVAPPYRPTRISSFHCSMLVVHSLLLLSLAFSVAKENGPRIEEIMGESGGQAANTTEYDVGTTVTGAAAVMAKLSEARNRPTCSRPPCSEVSHNTRRLKYQMNEQRVGRSLSPFFPFSPLLPLSVRLFVFICR